MEADGAGGGLAKSCTTWKDMNDDLALAEVATGVVTWPLTVGRGS